MKGFKGR